MAKFYNLYAGALLIIAIASSSIFAVSPEVALEFELYRAFFAQDVNPLPCRSIGELVKQGAKGDFIVEINDVSVDFASFAVTEFKSQVDALEQGKKIMAALETGSISAFKDNENYRKELSVVIGGAVEGSNGLIKTYTQRHKSVAGLVKKAKVLDQRTLMMMRTVNMVLSELVTGLSDELAENIKGLCSAFKVSFKIAGIECSMADLVEHVALLWQQRINDLEKFYESLPQDDDSVINQIKEFTLANLFKAVHGKILCEALCADLRSSSSSAPAALANADDLEALLKKNKRD